MANVTIKNRQILEAVRAINELDSFPFASDLMFALVRNAKAINEAGQDIDSARTKLRDQYSEHLDEEDGTLKGKVAERFNRDWQDILDQEVDLNIAKIKVSRLKPRWPTKQSGKDDGKQRPHIPITVFLALDFMLVMDVDMIDDSEDEEPEDEGGEVDEYEDDENTDD